MPTNKLAAATKKTRHSKKVRSFTGAFSSLLLTMTHDLACADSLDAALTILIDVATKSLGAERGTIFMNNPKTNELYSRVAQGHFTREIRILNSSGIAGWVFTRNKGIAIKDAYKDNRFLKEVDERTGFRTRNILCVPLRNLKGEKIGVSQILNKSKGPFTQDDLRFLEHLTEHAAIILERFLIIEDMKETRQQELEFMDIVSQVSSEIQLASLLRKIIGTITKMLDAERSTLFINDEKTQELYTEVGEGLGATRIRFPNHLGISGTVFTSGKPINIPHAYADLRFNPSFDKQTGFFTRSILCSPVFNKSGKIIGVTQVLNKRGGSFTKEDQQHLEAFTSQIAIGIENATLFDNVQTMKNYNESILQSMSNAVITINEDGTIITCNDSGLTIFDLPEASIVNKTAKSFFSGANSWLYKRVKSVEKTGEPDSLMDAELILKSTTVSVNVSITPLISSKDEKMGVMVLIEDISTEKRMKSTMSRYMDVNLADKLLDDGDNLLGGVSNNATVLFSDIRSFTSLTETLGAEGTVTLLNDYFTRMVDCIQQEGGMLDKFIGDAIMAVFGMPFPHDDDVDRALRSGIQMMNELDIFNQIRQKQQKDPIQIGIGINTDMVVSGNIGSPKRMDYTVIGDGVNLASRLEGACKTYGTKILISGNTFNALKATYRTREIDKVVVKGKTQPVSIFEVLDYHTPESFPNMVDTLGNFQEGYGLYQAGKFAKALVSFKKALTANPLDAATNLYVDRCTNLKSHPPKEWNGVFVMTSK